VSVRRSVQRPRPPEREADRRVAARGSVGRGRNRKRGGAAARLAIAPDTAPWKRVRGWSRRAGESGRQRSRLMPASSGTMFAMGCASVPLLGGLQRGIVLIQW